MAITETDHSAEDHGHGPAVAGAENPGGEHETAYKRDQKERLLIWLLIGGDLLFLVLEVFTWFYLRALNVNGLWNGAQCTKANPCTDGLGNPITAPITRADPKHAIIIAVLTVIVGGLRLDGRVGRQEGRQASVAGLAGLGFLFMLAAIGWQIYQFQVIPFTTIDGAYASTYEFFMGSTLAHLILLAFIGWACGSGPARAATRAGPGTASG